MLLKILITAAVSLVGTSHARGPLPRATSAYSNSTITSFTSAVPTNSLQCCGILASDVQLVVWYSTFASITVATISTIVYKYNNTAVTDYVTVTAPPLPSSLTGTIGSGPSIPGVPTDLITGPRGIYSATSLLVSGTEFTDPYGQVFTSPTPFWYISAVGSFTAPVDVTATACPTNPPLDVPPSFGIPVYPSGWYFAAPNATKQGQPVYAETQQYLPTELRSWIYSHNSPTAGGTGLFGTSDAFSWSNVHDCTMGNGDGFPIAHIPVTELTEGVTTTSTMTGNYGTVIPSTTPTPTPTPTPQPQTPTTTLTPAPLVPPTTLTSGIPNTVPTSDHPASGNTPGTAPADSPGADPVVTPSVPVSADSSASVYYLSQHPGTEALQAPTNPAEVTEIISTATRLTPAQSPTPMITIGDITFTGIPQSGIPIGSSTLTPGGTVIVSSPGAVPTTYVLPTSATAIVVNGQNQAIQSSIAPAAQTTPVIVVGGSTITQHISSGYAGFAIGSQTLTPGGTVVVSGTGSGSPTTYVLPSTPSVVIVNGVTSTVQTGAAALKTTPILIVGSSTVITNSETGFQIGSQTLTLGGTITLAGSHGAGPTTYVLPSSATAIIINGATQAIQSTAIPQRVTKAATLVLGSLTYTANSASAFVIGSETLTPGGVITVSDETISLQAGGSTAIIVDSSATKTANLAPAATLVIGASTYTANSASAFVVAGQTLTPGGVITASGEVISLQTGGATAVVASGGVTTTEGLGGAIQTVGGFGTASPSQVQAAKASSGRQIGWWGMAVGSLGVIIEIWM